MNAKNFFSAAEMQMIREAIVEAELNTSGEIRVHIDTHCKVDVLDRAAYVFKKIKMHETAARNGVLIYMAVKDRKFAIIGDEGINMLVEENFWDEMLYLMAAHFKRGDYAEGIRTAIAQSGKKLKKFFPYQKEDVNELSDEISFGN